MCWDLLDLLIAFSGLQRSDQSAAPCLWTVDTLKKQTEFTHFFLFYFIKNAFNNPKCP